MDQGSAAGALVWRTPPERSHVVPAPERSGCWTTFSGDRMTDGSESSAAQRKPRWSGAGIVLGIALGIAVGTATNNVGAGIAIGVAMGVALGAMIGRKT
jgi:hypothetical protein